jgi:hypothetical protein
MGNEYEYRVLKNENEFTAYEKCLYTAFVIKRPNKFVIDHYIHLEGNRLRSRYPYEDQEVYCIIKNKTDIVSGVALHFTGGRTLQLEEVGFKKPGEYNDKNCCEGLVLFNLEEFSPDFMKVMRKFFVYILDQLQQKKYEYLFTTCDEELFEFYSAMGFEPAAELKLNYVKKLLLKYTLDR